MNRFERAPQKNLEKPRTPEYEDELDFTDPSVDTLDTQFQQEPLASEIIDRRWLGAASHPPSETETMPQYEDRLLKLVIRMLEEVAKGSHPGQLAQDADTAWSTLAYMDDLRNLHKVMDHPANAQLVEAVANAYLGVSARPNMPEGAKQMLRKGWEQFRETFPTKSQEQPN